jgi:hypothetical protein
MACRQKANPGLVFADHNNVMDPTDNPNDSDDSDDEMYIDNDSDDDGNNWSDPDDEGDADPSDDDSVDESEDDDNTAVPVNDDDVVGNHDKVNNNDIDAMSADGIQNVDTDVTDGDEDDNHGNNDDVQQDFNVDVDDANDGTEPEEESGVGPTLNDETGKETGVSDAPVRANQGVDATDMDERYGPQSGRYNLRR